jgi:predicted secreted protein
MRWTSMLAIFTLFWVLSAFLVMPFGVRTHDELGVARIPGQAHSAPANFNPRLIMRRATVLSFVLFGLYYENYVNHWITWQDIDISPWLGLT